MLDTNSIIAKNPVTPMAEVPATPTAEKASTNVNRQQQSLKTKDSVQLKKENIAEQKSVEKSSEKLVDELNKELSILNTRLSFSVDEKTNKTVVRIIDTSNNDVIKQFPPEYLLKVSQKITELIGLVVDEKI
jgi:flagellar protein FlaG